MIHKENVTIGTREFLRTYSDTYMIKKVENGAIYLEALDIIPCRFNYVETDIELPKEEDEQEKENFEKNL